MKSYSEKDIWDHVKKCEELYGDRAEAIVSQKIVELIAAKEFEDAALWCTVAARLQDLHQIKLQVVLRPGQSPTEA